MNPPTFDEATARGLIVEKGIDTFSNGSEWECWADSNCLACQHYDMERIGLCAFEGAALMQSVSPALALLFGWTEHAEYLGSYQPPQSCRFFADGDSDEDGPRRRATPIDPRQLVLLADPNEDAAMIDGDVEKAADRLNRAADELASSAERLRQSAASLQVVTA